MSSVGSIWAEALWGVEGKKDICTTQLLFNTALLLLDVPSKLDSAGSSLSATLWDAAVLSSRARLWAVYSGQLRTDKRAGLPFGQSLSATYCPVISGMKLPALTPSYTSLSAFNLMLFFVVLMNYLDHATDFSGTGIWLLNVSGVWRSQTLLHTHEVTTSSSEIDFYDNDPSVYLLEESFVIICGNKWISVTAEMLLHRLTSSLSPTRNCLYEPCQFGHDLCIFVFGI